MDTKLSKWVLPSAIIIGAAVALWFGDRTLFQVSQTQTSHQLVGQVSNVSGGKIQAYGFHILDADPNKSDFTNRQNFIISFGPYTKFVKTIWNMPTKETLAKTTKVIYGASYSSVKTGSIDDIKNTPSISITVKTAEDTLNTQSITATEIDYDVVVYK